MTDRSLGADVMAMVMNRRRFFSALATIALAPVLAKFCKPLSVVPEKQVTLTWAEDPNPMRFRWNGNGFDLIADHEPLNQQVVNHLYVTVDPKLFSL